MDLCENNFDSNEKFSVFQMRESLEALAMEEGNKVSLKRVKLIGMGIFNPKWTNVKINVN